MRLVWWYSVVAWGAALAGATFHRNLVYHSPFEDYPELSHDFDQLTARQSQHARRQMTGAAAFKDNEYPTFYGSDFSNAPFIWTGGINFTHSVASGDPFDTSVLIWTRAFPLGAGPDQSVPVCVSYKVFTSSALSGKPVSTGEGFTTWDVDFTLKFEVTDLKPDSVYFYVFADCTNAETVSPTGRTRTLPSPNTPASAVNGGKPLTLAVFSCSQFQAGWFNAYGYAAHNTSAEIFVHLGDYIYESLGNGAHIGRQVQVARAWHLGRELATIHDYRQRLGQYRTDASLLAAHQNAPWITVWDDHEVADNSWKAGTTDSNDTAAGCSFSPSGACFTDRKLAAVRAYHEWLPVRQVSTFDKLRIWRNFQIGKLLDLTMLDTRQYDRDVTDVNYNHDLVVALSTVQNRSLMGPAQEKWFFHTLSESQTRGAVWRIVGQQIVFSQLDYPTFGLDVDAWDGYKANRERVLQYLERHKISNTVILSGDSHANWVSELAHPNDTATYDAKTGKGALGVEFAGTAVTSGSPFGANVQPAVANAFSQQILADPLNGDLQWTEGSFRGFFTLTIDPRELNATYYAMNNISFANLDGFASAVFTVKAGENKLTRPIAGGKVLAGVLRT
ncbi:unnamed protein product [Mycena citricolor]|uniref:Alkaline phosphatase D n=1 Tax=Mycena citricolor TaxID=2018698 RepID=A0AAD2GXZ9_9AGAR|nr:unnamed protein product [Mycena citricolor]